MRVQAESFRLHKAGNSPEDYEDAAHPAHVERRFRRFRGAIADGATESSFAGLWANLLVREYCRGRIGRRLDSCELAGAQAVWRTQVFAKPLPWYAEEKVRSGAFSSLLGLTLSATENGARFSAIAVGDSCLFQWRDGRLILAFPICHAEEFGNCPYLVSSQPASNNGLVHQARRSHGEVRPGDLFVMMTDSLACWALGNWELGAGSDLLDDLTRGPSEFAGTIAQLRGSGRLRNDDVTLLRVEVN